MSASSAALVPVGLKRDGDHLLIDWSDGHHSTFTWKHLRQNCPCATCREERVQPPDPFRILTPQELAPQPPLAPTSMAPVGRYAYKIVWNDGHETGIFTIEALRSLCQCTQCSTEEPSSSDRSR
jgi:DUF971 family protein